MTQTIFLIGCAGGVVKCFALSENEWKPTFTFQEHTGWIRSLTKVNESMFVSTSGDCTAKLWDLRNQSSSLFTFRGHTDPVYSSVFFEEEKAIATGDHEGKIKVCSIKKHLKKYEEEGVAQSRASGTNKFHNQGLDAIET